VFERRRDAPGAAAAAGLERTAGAVLTGREASIRAKQHVASVASAITARLMLWYVAPFDHRLEDNP
jgi:hypothetical protein